MWSASRPGTKAQRVPAPRGQPVAAVRTSAPSLAAAGAAAPGVVAPVRKSATKPAAPAATALQDPITSEYVANLQQQIHFLELESQLLREKALDPGPALKSKATEANDAAVLNEPTTLDEHIVSLKANYIKMTKDLKEQIKALEKANDQLSQDNAQLVHTHQRLEEIVAAEQRRTASLQEGFAEEKRKMVEEIVGLQSTIKSLRDEIRLLNERMAVVAEERENALTRCEQDGVKATEQERGIRAKEEALAHEREQMNDLRAALNTEKARVAVLEGREKERAAEKQAWAGDIKKLQEEKWAQEVQIKTLTYERDQMRANRDKSDEMAKELQASNLDLQKRVDALQLELQQQGRDLMLLQRDQQTFAEGKAKMGELERLHAEQLKVNEAEMQARKDMWEQATAAHSRTLAQLKATDSDVEQLKREIAGLNERITAMKDEHSQLATQNRMCSEDLTKARAEAEADRRKAAALEDENAGLRTAVHRQQERLKMQKDIQDLSYTEFKQLRATNVQMASTLQELMAKLAALDPSAIADVALPESVAAASATGVPTGSPQASPVPPPASVNPTAVAQALRRDVRVAEASPAPRRPTPPAATEAAVGGTPAFPSSDGHRLGLSGSGTADASTTPSAP